MNTQSISLRNQASSARKAASALGPLSRKAAVVGEGVAGLTSAIRLAQAGYHVTVFSRNDLSSTASMSAGAYWWPHKLYPEHRVRKWAIRSLRIYRELSLSPDSGVFMESHRRYCVDPDDCGYARDLLDAWRPIDSSYLGLECNEAYEVCVPVIDVRVFMPFLKSWAHHLGINFVRRELSGPFELAVDFNLIVNCSGLGARTFVNDDTLIPIRGQILRMSLPTASSTILAQQEQCLVPNRKDDCTETALRHDRTSIRVFRNGQHFTLVLPRSNDIILGGTATSGDWSTTPSDQDTRIILQNCTAVAPGIQHCRLLEAHVGLRPGRSEVRLEAEQPTEHLHVVHNYGHGGGGFTVAWGCADEVVDLVQQCSAIAQT